MSFYKTNIALLSLGCPKNQVDSEILLGQLNGNRFQYTDNPNRADILIINTCSFIQDAVKESVDEILNGIQWKQEKSGRKLLVMGCLPERYPTELAKELPEVDGFFGLNEFSGIFGALEVPQRVGAGLPCATENDFENALFLKRKLLSPSHTAYLRISDGCSQGCRYCTIPRIRGPHRSRKPDDILREADKLAANGVVEFIVIGQETTSYGTDLKPKYDLVSLLHDISRISGIRWIRLMYTHPPALTDDMILGLAKVEHFCAYLDFPIEHAADRMLENMGRKTTKNRLRQQIRLLREVIPNISLRTSVIVGYPGEGEREFTELVDFLDEIRFEHLGVFVFSPEEGTPAYSLPGAVLPEEAQDRKDHLMILAEEWAEALNLSRIGQRMEVLVDEADSKQNTSIARTEGDAPEIDGTVVVHGLLKPGRFQPVKVTASEGYDLLAQIMNKE
jgi:ribosomal protein S12 methylthiotransferase